MQPPLDDFLNHELNAYIRTQLLDAIAQMASGQRYFTYNTFNVLLDADTSTATIEDELDVDRQSTLPLEAFREVLLASESP